jgi:hypothetical protein
MGQSRQRKRFLLGWLGHGSDPGFVLCERRMARVPDLRGDLSNALLGFTCCRHITTGK